MKRILRTFALLVFVGGIGLWIGFGQNRGWTRTTTAVQELDPVTQISYPVQKKGFWPGVDFLAVTTLASIASFGVSFLFRKKNKL